MKVPPASIPSNDFYKLRNMIYYLKKAIHQIFREKNLINSTS